MDIDFQKHIEDVRIVDADRNYWFIRTYGGETYKDFLENNYVGIGLNNVPYQLIQNAGNRKDTDAIMQLKNFIEKNTEYDGGVATRWANQLINFQHQVKRGDLVIIPEKNSNFYNIGVVESDVYVTDDNRTFYHNDKYEKFPDKRRNVTWKRYLTKEQIKRDLKGISSSHQALIKVNKYADSLEAYISNIYIKENKAYLTLRVGQEEDINAFAFRNFLNGLTYFYEEFCKEKGYKNNEELYIKIKVQSKGKLALKSIFTTGVLALGGLVLLSSNSEFKAEIGNSKFEFKSDGLLKSISDFLNESQERKIKFLEFSKSIDTLKVKQELKLENEASNNGVENGEENDG